ncbi:hypothetical protein LJK88_40270 [Paenibacillus sp. P26]|nr:hypothetical protein LJK88_40270 [Paenibacillus sp. P26]
MAELLMIPLVFILMGFRHGFDTDHVAAIADLVGAESGNKAGRQVKLGLMYVLGHGLIVLMLGMLAVFTGSRLPEPVLEALESLVGVSLVVLGAAVLITVFRQKSKDSYVSRAALVGGLLARLFGTKKLKVQGAGIAGAFAIGMLHGVGAETPTQLALISTTAGLTDALKAIMPIVLFTAGLAGATVLITYAASWSFLRAGVRRIGYMLGTPDRRI